MPGLLALPRRMMGAAFRRLDEIAYRVPSKRRRLEHRMLARLSQVGIPGALGFDFHALKTGAIAFTESLATEPDGVSFRFSSSAPSGTLYGSVYALLIHSLYGSLSSIPHERREAWRNLLDRSQSPVDGLFRDSSIACPEFENGDWWGARHLALHVVMAYTALGAKPRHSFGFLRNYDTAEKMERWLDECTRRQRLDYASNEIMNVGALLQYERDFFAASWAVAPMETLFDWLRRNIHPGLGLWWKGQPLTAYEKSLAVQTAYHFHPLFLYDDKTIPHLPAFIERVIATQNPLGGFGVHPNSTACEDIDSIYPLVKFSNHAADPTAARATLQRALPWVLSNRNQDGGFTWVRGRSFTYGHPLLSAEPDQSELFGTWFRSLSLAYLAESLGLSHDFHRNRCPGYEV